MSDTTIHNSPVEQAAQPPLDQALTSIRQALTGLRFGVVSIIVQDGVVVQIERTERNRLTKGSRRDQ
jgi:hypothetical protein